MSLESRMKGYIKENFEKVKAFIGKKFEMLMMKKKEDFTLYKDEEKRILES